MMCESCGLSWFYCDRTRNSDRTWTEGESLWLKWIKEFQDRVKLFIANFNILCLDYKSPILHLTSPVLSCCLTHSIYIYIFTFTFKITFCDSHLNNMAAH